MAQQQSVIVEWLVHKGVVRNRTQARMVLIVIIVLCIVCTLYLLSQRSSPSYGNVDEMRELYPELNL